MGIVWLSPIYRSPNDENGYDISDYRNVTTGYGTTADFDGRTAAMHARGLKLVMVPGSSTRRMNIRGSKPPAPPKPTRTASFSSGGLDATFSPRRPAERVRRPRMDAGRAHGGLLPAPVFSGAAGSSRGNPAARREVYAIMRFRWSSWIWTGGRIPKCAPAPCHALPERARLAWGQGFVQPEKRAFRA